MPKKKHTPEQIIGKLRLVELEIAKGQITPQACRKHAITEQTYYRWRKEYGGMAVEKLKKLKALERENSQLKKLVADQALDNAILKEALSGKY